NVDLLVNIKVCGGHNGIVVVGQIWIMSNFFFSSRRRHTRFDCDWSSDVCSSDLLSRQNVVMSAACASRAVTRCCPKIGFALKYRSEERRVGKECRSRLSAYH